jgi:hypothetical protein
MPEPKSNDTGDHSNDSGNHQTNRDTGYSAEYVKSLRDEAATWRTKLRDVETELNTMKVTISKQETLNSINTELSTRKIKVDPSWIKLEKDQSPKDAVDKFLKDYPQFAIASEDNNTYVPKSRKPMGAKPNNTNVENTDVSEIKSIKQDPIARAKLRDHYRALLSRNNSI